MNFSFILQAQKVKLKEALIFFYFFLRNLALKKVRNSFAAEQEFILGQMSLITSYLYLG